MILYNGPTSPFGRVARVVSLELGSAVEERSIDVYSATFLDGLNPLRQIPTLVLDDGQAIHDSRVICAYLDSISGRPTLYPGPPFGVMLLIGLIHLVAATALGAWQRIGFVQGLVIEIVAVAFLLLFLAQAMAALPSHTYAMPANAFVLVLLGVIVEFFVRALLRIKAAR